MKKCIQGVKMNTKGIVKRRKFIWGTPLPNAYHRVWVHCIHLVHSVFLSVINDLRDNCNLANCKAHLPPTHFLLYPFVVLCVFCACCRKMFSHLSSSRYATPPPPPPRASLSNIQSRTELQIQRNHPPLLYIVH